jgi:hypothetical protein
MAEPAVTRDFFLEPDGEEAAIVEPGDLVLERELLEARIAGLQLLVGVLEPLGERVDLVALVLDLPEDP